MFHKIYSSYNMFTSWPAKILDTKEREEKNRAIASKHARAVEYKRNKLQAEAAQRIATLKQVDTAKLQAFTGRPTKHRAGLISAARALLKRMLLQSLADADVLTDADRETYGNEWHRERLEASADIVVSDRQYGEAVPGGISLAGMLIQDYEVDPNDNLDFLATANAWLDPADMEESTYLKDGKVTKVLDRANVRRAIPSVHGQPMTYRIPIKEEDNMRGAIDSIRHLLNKKFVLYAIGMNSDDVGYSALGLVGEDRAVYNVQRLQRIVPQSRLKTFDTTGMMNFLLGGVLQFYDLEALFIRFYDDEFPKQDFRLFTSPSLNCVIDCALAATNGEEREYVDSYLPRYIHANAIYKEAKKRKASSAELTIIKNELINDLKVNGCNQEKLHALAKAMRVRFVVHHVAGVWYDTDPEDKQARKCVNIYGHNEHASLMRNRYRKAGMPDEVKYLDSDDKLMNLVINSAAPCEFVPSFESGYALTIETPVVQPLVGPYDTEAIKVRPATSVQMKVDLKKLRILSVQMERTVYKTYRPPSANRKFFKCTDELGFEVKQWKVGKGRPLKQPYYSIGKLADHNLGARIFKNINREQLYHGWDMKKAYPTYYLNPLYKRFGLPAGHVNLFVNSDVSYVDAPGWSLVTEIRYNSPMMEATQWVQPGCWYTHIRLHFVREHGLADFKISHTVVTHADFTLLPLRPIDDGLDSSKRFNNQFIGRLISGGSANTTSRYYHSTSPNERAQIIYEAKKLPNYVSAMEEPMGMQDCVEVITKSDARSQCYHTHSYIYDYQQTTMFDMFNHIPFHKIVGFNTDAVMFDGFESLDILPEYLRSRFKVEHKPIKFFGSAGALPHNRDYVVTTRADIDASELDSYFQAQGACVAVENSTPKFSVVHHVERPPHISQHLARLGRVTFTNGAAGCGKSFRSMISQRMSNAIVLTPTNLLKANHTASMEEYDSKQPADKRQAHTPVKTVHAFLQLDLNFKQRTEETEIPPMIFENVCIDEITMLTADILKMAVYKALSLGMNVHLYGDIDEFGIHQRMPAQGTPITHDLIMQYAPTCSTEVSHIRRQKLQRECEFLDSLRTLNYGDQLERIVCSGLVNFIDADQLPSLWESDSVGVSAVHANIYKHNKLLFDTLGQQQVPGRYIKSNRKIPKGTIKLVDRSAVWTGRKLAKDKTPDEYDYELAYVSTMDAIQGGTCAGRLFLDVAESGSHGALYTGITRATYLSNVYIIRAPVNISPTRALRIAQEAPAFYKRGLSAADPAAVIKPLPVAVLAATPKAEVRGDRITSRGVYSISHKQCDFAVTNTHRVCFDYGHSAYNIKYEDLEKTAYDVLRSMKVEFNWNEMPSKNIAKSGRLFLDIDMHVTVEQCARIDELLLDFAPDGDHKVLRNSESGKVHIIMNVPLCKFSSQVVPEECTYKPRPDLVAAYEEKMAAHFALAARWPQGRERTAEYNREFTLVVFNQTAREWPIHMMDIQDFCKWSTHKYDRVLRDEDFDIDSDDINWSRRPFDAQMLEENFIRQDTYRMLPAPGTELAIKMFMSNELRGLLGVDVHTWEKAFDYKAHGLRAAFSVKVANKFITSTAVYAPYNIDCSKLNYKQKAAIIADTSIYKPVTGAFAEDIEEAIAEGMIVTKRLAEEAATRAASKSYSQTPADESDMAGVMRLCDAAGLLKYNSFVRCVGAMYTFRRTAASHCELCKREHTNDNTLMVTTNKVDGKVRVFERCRKAVEGVTTRCIGEFLVGAAAPAPVCNFIEGDAAPDYNKYMEDDEKEQEQSHYDDEDHLAEDTTSWRD